MQRRLTSLDRLIATVDTALREVSSGTASLSGERPSPATDHSEADLTDAERQHAGGLMRINHTGEVCAQALYRGQALVAKSDETREALLAAAQEEKDHLDWCEERLDALGTHTSRLNPLFFASSYAQQVVPSAKQSGLYEELGVRVENINDGKFVYPRESDFPASEMLNLNNSNSISQADPTLDSLTLEPSFLE